MKSSRIEKLKQLFKNNDKNYFKWIAKHSKSSLKSIVLLVGVNTLIALITAGIAIINKYLIDYAVQKNMFNVGGAVILVVFTVSSMLINALSTVLNTYIFEKYSIEVRNKIYNSVLKSKWCEITKYHSGDLVTRLTSDIDSIAVGVSQTIPNMIYFFLRLIISFCVLFYYDRFIALLTVCVAPIGLLSIIAFGDRIKKFQDKLKKNESKYRSLMQESMENLLVVKAFEKEDAFNQKMQEIRNERMGIVMKNNTLNACVRMFTNLVFSLGYLIAFGWGIYQLSKGKITYGTMSIFITVVGQIKTPVISISSLIPQLINVLSSVGRIMEIDGNINEKSENSDMPEYIEKLGVSLSNVSFKYDGKNEYVLKNADLKISPEGTVGIIGGSGAGKTTFAKLVLNFVYPDSGEICLFNEDISTQISAESRRFISYVPQGNTLISGTIRENLRLGNENATDEEIYRALNIAEADFVEKLPLRLDTFISERAGTLSEGQAQRLAIARSILRKTPIILFDEATSSLDMECEKKIVSNLKRYKTGITCIIITHRYSLLEICDEIYEIKDKKFRLTDINL